MYRVVFLKRLFCCTLNFYPLSKFYFHPFIFILLQKLDVKQSFSKNVVLPNSLHVVHFCSFFTMLPFISGVVTCLLWKMMMPSICLIIALMFCRTRLTFLSSNLAFTFAFLLVLRLLTNHEPLKNDDVIKTETL